MPRKGRADAFGIDFGTTNSVVAVVSGPGPATALFANGDRPHPSVVWYAPGRAPVVGEAAKENINAFSHETGHAFVRSVKQWMGKDQSGRDVAGRKLPAYLIAAEIFKHLRAHADGAGYALDEAVVTVPVGFDGRARADIRRAAEEAGIVVSTFVHEPFAAILGHMRSEGRSLDDLNERLTVVFDWGGGTLDITVARSREGKIEELATGGLLNVAGDLFDEKVASWARGEFLRGNQLSEEQFTPPPGVKDRLAQEAEAAKIRLSDAASADLRVASVLRAGDRVLDMNERIQRTDFERMIRGDLDRAIFELEKTLEVAGVVPEQVDSVLMIGGTSEIPRLQTELVKRFATKVKTVKNPQSVIAEGAAVVAHEGFQPFLSAGIELRLADGSDYPVLPAGSVVPTAGARELSLYCTDNREAEARLIVRERLLARGASETKTLTVLPVPVVAELPKPYAHERVRARFEVNDDLILLVSAAAEICGEHAQTSVHDLKYGLRVR